MIDIFDDWIDRAREADLISIAVANGARLRRTGKEMVGSCPVCGDDGKRDADRFSINPEKRIFRCRKCGESGDVIALTQFVHGVNFLAACELINCAPPPDRVSTETEDQRALRIQRLNERKAEHQLRLAEQLAEAEKVKVAEIARAFEIWEAGEPLAGSHASAYLAGRGIRHQEGLRLRASAAQSFFAPAVEATGAVKLGQWPALLAAICWPDGTFRGVHITYLDRESPIKATITQPQTGEIVPAKKIRGSAAGGVIRLTGPTRTPVELIIGEGIETSLSPREAMIEAGRDVRHISFWSGVSLGNMGGTAQDSVVHPEGRFIADKAGQQRLLMIPGPLPRADDTGIRLPDSVSSALILMDGDSDAATTEFALLRCAARWAAPGRVVRRARAHSGNDFNDMWNRT